jgi:hypothetical protein
MCGVVAREGGPGEDPMCELVGGRGLPAVLELAAALRERGIDAVVWQAGRRGGRCTYMTGRGLVRLLVPRRDLTYARWILHDAAVDTWPA